MFHTRFNVAPILNKDKVYDRHDNVDRLSYVDNTRLIERFIYEGQNLANVRARALRSGLYSDAEAIGDVDGFAIPVYQVDPAIAQPMIESAKKSFGKSDVSRSDDGASKEERSADSDLTKRSPVATE